MRGLLLFALIVLTGLSVLNWRAQLQTQQKLDVLSMALAESPASPLPPPTEPTATPAPQPNEVPRELSGKIMPFGPYIIEAPDQLLIEAVVKDTKTGMLESLAGQAISGQFTVRLDGTVNLGLWGSVAVSGLTLEQAAQRVREHLAKSRLVDMSMENLHVVLDVLAYNSKKYYVITSSGSGEQVAVFPLTGNETVLDAIANIGSAVETANKSIRVVRKRTNGRTPEVLPVDWHGITENNITTTNYQLRAGDRLYVTNAGK